MAGLVSGFLSSSKAQVKNPSKSDKIHIVCGNEACDLDSAACSIALAYFFHATNKAKDNNIYAPLLNIQRNEYRLKTEVKYLLNKLNVEESSILFKDDVDLKTLCTHNRLKLTLVDFNVFPKEQEHLEKCVTRVIDHHVKRRKAALKVQVIIETVGSCSSLITEFIMKHRDFELPEEVAVLLYGAILIDTFHLEDTSRTTEKDIRMAKQLELKLKDLTRSDFYNEIMEAKLDCRGLTKAELLYKDLKLIKKTQGDKSVSLAISVINKNIFEFFDNESKIEDIFKEFLTSNNANALIIMFLQVLAGTAVRWLCVYSVNSKLLNEVITVLANHNNPPLNIESVNPTLSSTSLSTSKSMEDPNKSTMLLDNSLTQMSTSSKILEATTQPNFVAFKQWNSAASRKLVLPVLENHIDQLLKHV